MDNFDPNREMQVWQRVMEGPRPDSGDIRPLLLAAAENAALYRQLKTMLTGKQRERITRLYERAQRSVDALKGIQCMSGNSAGNLRSQPVPKAPARRLLETAFHGSFRLMTEYTARALDTEYGVVYQGLADREREAGGVLAELIGGLER